MMIGRRARFVIAAVVFACSAAFPTAQARPRARDLGIVPGVYPPGRLNAITDVTGVLVGHTTLIEGDDVRTGVTAVLAHGGNIFQDKVAGAVFVGNAFGKLAGSTQVTELGTIETPIVLTNTLSVGVAMDAVLDAIAHAGSGPVAEGSVGAGTGTVCYGWKCGIRTSSRTLPNGYIVGVLAQTNFGGNLTIAGIPVFRSLQPPRQGAGGLANPGADVGSGDGSCMLVVATDAPIDARDLGRLAKFGTAEAIPIDRVRELLAR